MSELELGMLVDYGGSVVEVIKFADWNKIVIETDDGEMLVQGEDLKPLNHGVAPVYSSMCEDAPCCGCCGGSNDW